MIGELLATFAVAFNFPLQCFKLVLIQAKVGSVGAWGKDREGWTLFPLYITGSFVDNLGFLSFLSRGSLFYEHHSLVAGGSIITRQFRYRRFVDPQSEIKPDWESGDWMPREGGIFDLHGFTVYCYPDL